MLGEHRVHSVGSAQSRFPAHARVDHPILELLGPQALDEQIDPALALRQAVACRQAVAVDHEDRLRARTERDPTENEEHEFLEHVR